MPKLVSFHIQAHFNAFLQILEYIYQNFIGACSERIALYLITRNRVLLETLPISQLVSNSHSLYNTKIQHTGICWWSRS